MDGCKTSHVKGGRKSKIGLVTARQLCWVFTVWQRLYIHRLPFLGIFSSGAQICVCWHPSSHKWGQMCRASKAFFPYHLAGPQLMFSLSVQFLSSHELLSWPYSSLVSYYCPDLIHLSSHTTVLRSLSIAWSFSNRPVGDNHVVQTSQSSSWKFLLFSEL